VDRRTQRSDLGEKALLEPGGGGEKRRSTKQPGSDDRMYIAVSLKRLLKIPFKVSNEIAANKKIGGVCKIIIFFRMGNVRGAKKNTRRLRTKMYSYFWDLGKGGAQ